MRTISVLLADDHLLFREGLASLLKASRNIKVVGNAQDGRQAIEMTRELMPDVVLMDVQMPGVDGLDATRQIKQEMPAVHVIMLTVSEDSEDLFEAIKCGAQGYLLKNTSAVDLQRYVVSVFQGEAPISGLMAAKMLGEFSPRKHRRGSDSGQAPVLTERETQVLERVAEGKSNREIAVDLHLSENTIKKYFSNILAKLHLQNRVQAAMFARAKAKPRVGHVN